MRPRFGVRLANSLSTLEYCPRWSTSAGASRGTTETTLIWSASDRGQHARQLDDAGVTFAPAGEGVARAHRDGPGNGRQGVQIDRVKFVQKFDLDSKHQLTI
jgi:hypothetical protein